MVEMGSLNSEIINKNVVASERLREKTEELTSGSFKKNHLILLENMHEFSMIIFVKVLKALGSARKWAWKRTLTPSLRWGDNNAALKKQTLYIRGVEVFFSLTAP